MKNQIGLLIACFMPFLFSLILFPACSGPAEEGVLTILSAHSKSDTIPSGWRTEYWSDQKFYAFAPSDRSDYMSLIIDADTLAFARWVINLPLRPYSRYRISGWIKTENVVSEREGDGAGFRLGKMDINQDITFSGDTDWTFVDMQFDTGGDDSAMLECILGKGGRAKGKVFFDEMTLEWLSSETLQPGIRINPLKQAEPMSALMFGQFIEHMGNCIYGGIWAEMIEDRKFFDQPGHERSPWQVYGDPDFLSMQTSRPFVGSHDPVITNNAGSNGLSQKHLGLIKGMDYEGRLIMKADESSLPVTVQLIWDEPSGGLETMEITETGEGFQTIPLRFSSPVDTHEAEIRILVHGQGRVQLGTISLMPSNNVMGFRADVLELLKKLDSPVYRWPGGNFVSGYNWEDGIGPRDRRPPRFEAAWNGIEPNDVGIDEFMLFCELLNTEANIAVNTGLGTPQQAAEQVGYVNGTSDTPMGRLRAQNGRLEPYGVQLWAVGNEMFGDWQLGVMPIEDYVKKHNDVARLMWEADSSISLIAVGYPGRWNDMMYTHCADYMTYVSEHFYRQDWHAGGLMTHVKQIPDAIREIAEEHRRCRREIPGIKEKNIKIALDEWNYWYGPHIWGLLGTRYFLQDALGIAAGFNEFLRQSDIFYMANYAQTVNVIGAIKASKTTSFLEGTGEVLQLYRRELGTIPIELSGNMAPLDVAASLSSDRKYLTISVINPTMEEQMLALEMDNAPLAQTGDLFYITGSDRYVYNDVGNPEIIETQTRFRVSRGSVKVPAMSACIFKFEMSL
jgi:alpha-L-arabinofuranosidase